MEATKKCQKIKKSMGRRNAICLWGGAALSVPLEVGRGVGGAATGVGRCRLPPWERWHSAERRFTKRAPWLAPHSPHPVNK